MLPLPVGDAVCDEISKPSSASSQGSAQVHFLVPSALQHPSQAPDLLLGEMFHMEHQTPRWSVVPLQTIPQVLRSFRSLTEVAQARGAHAAEIERCRLATQLVIRLQRIADEFLRIGHARQRQKQLLQSGIGNGLNGLAGDTRGFDFSSQPPFFKGSQCSRSTVTPCSSAAASRNHEKIWRCSWAMNSGRQRGTRIAPLNAFQKTAPIGFPGARRLADAPPILIHRLKFIHRALVHGEHESRGLEPAGPSNSPLASAACRKAHTCLQERWSWK